MAITQLLRRSSFLSALLVSPLAYAQGAAGELSVAELGAWLSGYESAWETKSPDAVAQLFVSGALYYETPYAEPFRGLDGIREYWSNVTADQRDIDFQADIVGTVGNTGIARWSATFTSMSSSAEVELNGVFLLEFDQDGLCAVLREWWHVR